MSKFNKTIVESIKNDENERKQQLQLKSKYSIPEDDSRIIIEKNNMLKFMINTIGKITRIVINIIIFFFSVAGATALIFPESRGVLLNEISKAYEQLLQFIR